MAHTPLPPTAPSFWEPFKWAVFRALEILSDVRGNAAAVSKDALPSPAGQRALWVFVSTIGELNAIGPFLRELVKRLDHLQLVLITDHEHYRASYLAQYASAVVFVTGGHSRDAKRLARHFPPAMLVVGEIPCLPSDAPCRFSYAFLRAARKQGAAICLVNGWLYHYKPACRMDDLETRLFRQDYIRAFDIACVQSEEVRNALIEAGADPKRVGVTGNIKFDAAEYPGWSTTMARDPALLASIVASKRVVIVAGCMTSGEEQTHVLSAFSDLLSKHQNALLVIAPRHPEKSEIIATLAGALEKLGIIHLFRTQLRDEPLPNHVSCLILDTIGELRDFYAAASIAYVGRNHNILEPLGFGKPTVVRAGWNRLYPSYSVYEIMLRAGGIYQIEGESELCTLLDSMLTDTANGISLEKKAELALITATGATRRNMECLEPILRAVSDLH